MNKLLPLGIALAALALPGCDSGTGGKAGGENANAAGESNGKTIGAGIDQNSRFFAAAKAAGLDQTLAGPGPYTVLVPADDAFAKLPAGITDNWGQPTARADVTRVLTYHILPGTILAEDIGKAIDNAKGPAQLATMGGGILTATKEGGKIILTDGAGTKATVTQADDRFSNGVVHHIDTVLMPAKDGAPAPQPEQNAQ